MPFIVPFIPLIAAVAGPLLSKALGGGAGADKTDKGGSAAGGAMAAAAPAAARLFQPDMISKATDQYRQQGMAKWNQILANMGAGGGTGGPDLTSTIDKQAASMAGALGGLTTQSGYGDNPQANLAAILQGVEPSIGAQYPVY